MLGVGGLAYASVATHGWSPANRNARVAAVDAPAITSPETFTVIGRGGSTRFVDLPPSGPSQGDDIVVFERLYDRSGDVVGEVSVQEVVTRPDDFRALATFSAVLYGKGQITVQAEDTNENPLTLAVTGGTGRYRNVRGQVEVTFRPDSELYTFTLIP